MKLTKITTVFLIIFSSLFSCDKIDELTEFDTNVILTEALDISIDEEGTQSFSKSVNLNIAEDSDVADNLDKIESVTITSLYYTFSNVMGNAEAQLTNAQLVLGGSTIEIDPVSPGAVMGQRFEIENATVLNALENTLRNNPQVTAIIQGSVAGAPVSFIATLKMEVMVTIDAG